MKPCTCETSTFSFELTADLGSQYRILEAARAVFQTPDWIIVWQKYTRTEDQAIGSTLQRSHVPELLLS